jgi:hypothetical protein
VEAVDFIKQMQSCADHEIRIEELSLNGFRNRSPSGYVITMKGPICDDCRQNTKLIAKEHGYQIREESNKVIIYTPTI